MTDDRRRSTFGLHAQILLLFVGVLIYVGAFVYYSRFSPTIVADWDSDDYWFNDTINDDGEAGHQRLCRIFWPLIEIDARLVSGRRPLPPPRARPLQIIYDIQESP
ncbi:hypothetical protein [Blastopirellula marina]|uniref:Uncharacterized protein n=1 Tax=Blastopirellula marina TaxID=124 RepID=A0A2S8GHS9_9BACT|nr:hypothetical protein [Blastopirellula marina]PQO43987.1 hypothetical protein C5Y93_20820 [Blastopirellula marina]